MSRRSGCIPETSSGLSTAIRGSQGPGQYGRRRRARRVDHSHGRSGDRNRPRRGRARRRSGVSRHARGDGRQRAQPDRRFSGRPARRGAQRRGGDRRTMAGSAWPEPRGNNLQNITVEFPLGVLCLVTGVSGSGKSTLVQDTLYPALCRRMHKDAVQPCAVRRRVRRRPNRRRDPGRSKPHRPLAAIEPGDLHQGLRRDSGRVRRNGRSPHAQLRRRPFQLQCRRRPLHGLRRRRLHRRSTCSSWPTSI